MKVISFPVYRPDIQQVAEYLKQEIYKQCSGLSVSETIGILEVIKNEIMNEQY
jgi:hypothetical protein